ncbi:MAG: hypothetical protein NTY63_07725, partial [Candidatus Bipolaricaulota bacterium]|nr:hypothetical protein [Candidatus Bipolaricaulota bacterium]
AVQVLRREPDPPVRVRLLRDVLDAPSDDPRRRSAGDSLKDSPHVRLLMAEQRDDGSWGRLHSRDTHAAAAVPTTEWAVERAVALGVDRDHPMLRSAADHLAAVVTGRAAPSDPPERNDRWPTGVVLFAAATLALVDSEHPALDPVWALWHEIARRTFAGGTYDPDAETAAHRNLTGASIRGTYLTLENRYAVALLGSRADRVDPHVRAALYRWLWNHPKGLGYLAAPPAVPPSTNAASGFVERWIWSHELLASLSPHAAVGPILDALEANRRDDGLWDLGSRASFASALPLSTTWRTKDTRAVDWTTRILALASRWMSDPLRV